VFVSGCIICNLLKFGKLLRCANLYAILYSEAFCFGGEIRSLCGNIVVFWQDLYLCVCGIAVKRKIG
jgi:hypothetical protein